MRYSVMGSTVQQVRAIGGLNIKEASTIKAIFAELTETQAARLRLQRCKVTKIEKVKTNVMPPTPVEAAPVYTPQELAWAAGFEELRAVTDPPLYGSGFNLAIVDSGIRESHELIGGRVVYRKNFTTDIMRDGLNHGTGVASIAVTVAPFCNILNIKVLDDDGEGTEEDVTLAMDHLIGLHDNNSGYAPHVINLSLGSSDTGDADNILRVICREAISRGIWVVAAAGNDGPTSRTIICPACEQYVDAVGSASYDPFSVSIFSSRGPTLEGVVKPDELMFGENIVVASSEGDKVTIPKTGTSFSAPFISGITILYEELLTIPAVQEQLRQALIQAGYSPEVAEAITPEVLAPYLPLVCVKPKGIPAGKDNDYGYGLYFAPNMLQALGLVRPVVDISTILSSVTPILALGMLAMVIVPMAKEMK